MPEGQTSNCQLMDDDLVELSSSSSVLRRFVPDNPDHWTYDEADPSVVVLRKAALRFDDSARFVGCVEMSVYDLETLHNAGLRRQDCLIPGLVRYDVASACVKKILDLEVELLPEPRPFRTVADPWPIDGTGLSADAAHSLVIHHASKSAIRKHALTLLASLFRAS